MYKMRSRWDVVQVCVDLRVTVWNAACAAQLVLVVCSAVMIQTPRAWAALVQCTSIAAVALRGLSPWCRRSRCTPGSVDAHGIVHQQQQR